MKNKAIHDLVKQLHFDVRTSEENIKRLADDLIRVEKQFSVLWEHVFKLSGDIAPEPNLQPIRCDECGEMSKDYKLETMDGYCVEVKCKSCLIKEERERVENED